MAIVLPATLENFRLCKRIICDTNILISYFDTNSAFNLVIKNAISNTLTAEKNQTQFLYTLISYLEGIEFMRRKTMTAVFNSIYGKTPTSTYSKTLDLYRRFSRYNAEHDIPYFFDYQIKKIREAIMNSQKGPEAWKKILNLQAKNEFLSNFYQFNTLKAFKYARLNSSEEFPKTNLDAWIQWSDVENLIRTHGTSHMDSAILKLTTLATHVDGFLSNDRDLIISAVNDSLPSNIKIFTFLNT